MQKKTLKKLSILGLVLMAASAVTAAILPASKEDKQQQYSVSVGPTNDSPNTTGSCAPTVLPDSGDTCNGPTATAGSSGSTENGAGDPSSDGTTLI